MLNRYLNALKIRWGIYSLLSKIYKEEQTVESLQDLLNNVDTILTSGSELLDGAFMDVFEHLQSLRMLINDLLKQDSKQMQSLLAKEYAHLFLGFGKFHPSESSYRSESGSIMQEFRDDVLEVYKKFGVRKIDEFKEPEDHIAVELQFMAYLCRRTIEALNNGGGLSEAKKYLEAQRDFLNNHLASWVPKLAEDILKSAENGFYKEAAYLTAKFIQAEKVSIPRLISVENMPDPKESVVEELPKESLLTSLDPAEKEEGEIKSYYKTLGPRAPGLGGNLKRDDCKHERILTIRPMHND